MFDLLIKYRLCTYQKYNFVEVVAKEFISHDLDIMKLIDDYKKNLGAFFLGTKISDYIKVKDRSIKERAHGDNLLLPRYSRNYYSDLQIILDITIEEKHLSWVNDVWNSIANYCNLPSLPALLESIQQKCLMVTWMVPVLSGIQVQACFCMKGSKEFFQQHKIVRVVLNDEPLYDEELNEV